MDRQVQLVLMSMCIAATMLFSPRSPAAASTSTSEVVRTATPSSYAIADVPESKVTVRVGTTPNDSNAEAFYAQEMGFFRQAGLNVELTSFNNGASAAAAMASSSIDISISPPMQIAQAISHGLPFIVIAAGALNTIRAPAAWIVVAKNSPI